MATPLYIKAAQTAGRWVEPVLGIMGAGGAAAQNRTNVRLARENRAWQERMSSTAVSRSVQDYIAAGLNPALAYERSASTPGGETAIVNNVAKEGLDAYNSARAARDARQAMQNQAALMGSQIDVNKKTSDKTQADADLSEQLQLESRARTTGIHADNAERETEAEFWNALKSSGAGASGKGIARVMMFLRNILPQPRR